MTRYPAEGGKNKRLLQPEEGRKRVKKPCKKQAFARHFYVCYVPETQP